MKYSKKYKSNNSSVKNSAFSGFGGVISVNIKNFIPALFSYLIFFSVSLQECHSQDNSGSSSWLPRSLSVDLSADGWLGFGKKEPGFGIGQIRLLSTLSLKNNLNISAFVESDRDTTASWYEFGKRNTYLSQLYIQYHDYFKIFSGNFNLNTDIGKLNWYPSYTDPLQITQNLNAYYNPPAFYGINYNLDYSFAFTNNLSAHIDGYAGKIIGNGFDFSLNDAYISYNPEYFRNFGISFQAGKSAGTKYLVNEAIVYFRPVLYDKVSLKFGIGKFPGLDATPYGVGIGGEINLKYVLLGAYYEYRFNQPQEQRNMVFYWSIIGPEVLANILNTYQIILDLNTNSILFNIPFLNLKFL